ncbi:MAG: hypothetical protein NTAFB01_32980 [Nitrospira sp.]
MPDQPEENEDRADSRETSPGTIRDAKQKDHVERKMKEMESFRVNLPVSVRY